MKKLASVFLVVCMLFLLGCNPIPKGGYRYIEENGYYYLTFRDELPPSKHSTDEQIALLTFSSVAEMKEAIDDLSPERIEAMKYAFATDREKNRIYVCDFEQFYEPVFPDNVINNQTVWWMSMHYFVSCTFTFDEETTPKMGITTPGAYEDLLNRQKTKFDNSEGYDSLSKEYDAERNADVYTYINGYIRPEADRVPLWKKEVHYTLTDGKKTVHVVEEYSSSDDTGKLAAFPNFIQILIADNGGYLTGSFYWHQEEVPSAEWLLSFGVQPFVPEESPAA